MPHEEPMPPLDAILDGSGVRYYSKRTRALTSLEKKLETAREAFHAARKEQGLAEPPKLFHGSGSAPARPTAGAAAAVSSAALRRQLHKKAVESGSRPGSVEAGTGASGGVAAAPAAAAAAGGGGSSGGGSRPRYGRESDFQRFSDSMVGGGRGPVVMAQPYHSDARTFFNLSLLPTSVRGLSADSGLYYTPAATTRGEPGPRAKGLRESMLRYYQPDLAVEREERERCAQQRMAERLADAQEALGDHIQSLVARWGPGFLDRLTAAAEAEASGEAGRNSRLSGGSLIPNSARGGGSPRVGARGGGSPGGGGARGGGSPGGSGGGGARGGGSPGARREPLKLHLSAGGVDVPASAADATYEFEHYRKATARPQRTSSPPVAGGTYGRRYGTGQVYVSAATLERLSYLADQLKVPVEQIATLLRKPGSKPGSAGGEGRTSPSGAATKRSGGGGGGHVVGVAGAHQTRRIELLPARRPATSKQESGATAAASTPTGAATGAREGAAGADGSAAPSPKAADTGRESPFATPESAASAAEIVGTAGSGEATTPSAAAAAATAAGGAAAQRRESVKSKGGKDKDASSSKQDRDPRRHIHLAVAAAAAAERDNEETAAAAAVAAELPRAAAPDAGFAAASVTTATATPSAAPSTLSSAAVQSAYYVTLEVPRTPVDGERPPPAAAAAASGLSSSGEFLAGASPHRQASNQASPLVQLWSAFPSRRARSQASGSAGASPATLRLVVAGAAGGTDNDDDGVSGGVLSPPISPTAFHHRSGVSFVSLGQAVPAGPSLEGLQPADPRARELEAASRAALESLARRHGDSRRSARRSPQAAGGGVTAGASRGGSASTGSRPGTSGGVTGGGGQSQRRSRSRPPSRPSGMGSRGGTGSAGGGGGAESRRPTAGGMSVASRGEDPVFDAGGGLRFSERGSGDESEGGRGGAGAGAGGESSARRRGGGTGSTRLRSAGSRHSVRSARSGATASARRRGRTSPTSAHSVFVVSAATAAVDGPGSSGEEVIMATGDRYGRPSPRRSAGGDGGGGKRSGLRRLSEMADSVGLRVGTARSRRTSSPRSSGTAGLLDSSDEASTEDGEEGDGEEGRGLEGDPWVSRPSTGASVNGGGGLQLSWDVPADGAVAAAAAVVAADSRPVSSLTALRAMLLSASSAPAAAPPAAPPAGMAAAGSSTARDASPPPVAAAAAAEAATANPLKVAATSTSGRSGGAGRPEPGLNPPGLSRHYKLAGSRWNPTAPGALRPGYGTEADYVAGTYNPDLMERVAAARDTSALTGEEAPVDYKSPVLAASARASLPTPPSAAAAAVANGSAAAAAATPQVRKTLDLSVLSSAGRAAAANAKAAAAIADVLNPITRALTNAAALAAANGSDLPPSLQVLATARGGATDGKSPVAAAATATATAAAATAAAAAAVARHLIPMLPRSPVPSQELTARSALPGTDRAAAVASASVSTVAAAAASTVATAADPSLERVMSRFIRPSQSVWGRAELDEHDILLPLKQHLSLTATTTLTTVASGGGAAAAASPQASSRSYTTSRRRTTDVAPAPALGSTAAAASAAAAAAAAAAERRATTAPAGTRPPQAGASAAASTPAPVPEPRLWRGDPLELKAAFPKGEKVYRLVTDVQAHARLLREVEKDITPVEFRNRLRRGVVL